MKGPAANLARRSAEQRADSDAAILARLAEGDISSLAELYDRYQESVRRFVVRATSDAEDVDDLVHATFLAAAKSAARYDGRDSCRPWLVGIAVQLLRRRRQAFARLFAALSALRAMRTTVAADPQHQLQAKGDIERVLPKLSEAKRITLLLAEVEGFSGPEIAEILGVPVGTVWTRLHAARRELRALLESGGER